MAPRPHCVHSLSDTDVSAEDGGMLAKHKYSLRSQSIAVKRLISGTERQTRAAVTAARHNTANLDSGN